MANYSDSVWFSYLGDRERQLVEVAYRLLEREQELNSDFLDYSFIVFPIAKAYEGFLKRFFFDLELIDQHTFEGRRFRIGRAINPDIRHDQRDQFWLFDDISRICSEETARQLWETWLECHNRIFHFFPKEIKFMTLQKAGLSLNMIASSIQLALECDGARQFINHQRQINHQSLINL